MEQYVSSFFYRQTSLRILIVLHVQFYQLMLKNEIL